MKEEKDIKPREENDIIFNTLDGLAQRVEVMLNLYPRATKEVFKSYKLEVKTEVWGRERYTKEELREVAMSQLLVDITKKKYERE